jgi:GAF domain-containing protein
VREDPVVVEALIGARSEIERSSLGLEAVMQLVCDTGLQLTGADVVAADLLDGEELVTQAVAGDPSTPVGMRFSLGGSLSGHCVRVGHTLRCDDALHDPRVDFRAAAITGLRSALCVPLVHYGVPVGALKVGARRTNAFDDHDADVLAVLSELIVVRLGELG